MIFREYAITPEALGAGENEVAHHEILRELFRELNRAGLLRGVCWERWLSQVREGAPTSIKWLLDAMLANGRRIMRDDAPLPASCRSPSSESEWVEAAETSARRPLFAIVTRSAQKSSRRAPSRCVSVQDLPSQDWWSERAEAWSIWRSASEFAHMLAIPIHHANSLVFVDPYVDPTVWRYADFFRLLEPLRSRPQKPVLQVHCAADRVGSNPLSLVQLVERFRTLEDALLSWNLKLTVYFWNRRTFRGGFHDRFLITDLGAFGCSNGFEVSPQTKMRVWLLPQADGRELQLQLSENYQRPERILEVGVGVVAGVDARRR